MKPSRFRYHRVESRQEAVGLLAEHGPGAQLLAGGQSLVPMLNRREVRPDVLIDITRAKDIQTLSFGRTVRLGAGVTQHDLEKSADLAHQVPLLRQAVTWVGSIATRNRGTLGGSAAFADPAGELPAALCALDAEFAVGSRHGERIVLARDFFVDAFRTSLAEDEMVTDIRLQPPAPGARSCFIEVARRRGGSRALVGVAAVLQVGEDGVCTSARLALSGVAATPLRASASERLLIGERIGGRVVAAAVRATVAGLRPPSDPSASGESRKEIAASLLERAIGIGSVIT